MKRVKITEKIEYIIDVDTDDIYKAQEYAVKMYQDNLIKVDYLECTDIKVSEV